MKYVYAAVACLLSGFCLPGTAQKLPEPPHDCPRLIEPYGEQADPADVKLPDFQQQVSDFYGRCAPEHDAQAGDRKGE